ncbi:MAG: hypothetical protein RR893_14175 [Clostridia bacterium]
MIVDVDRAFSIPLGVFCFEKIEEETLLAAPSWRYDGWHGEARRKPCGRPCRKGQWVTARFWSIREAMKRRTERMAGRKVTNNTPTDAAIAEETEEQRPWSI